MTDHLVVAEDEGRHEPDAELLWNESFYADFVSNDGSIGGFFRLGLYPNKRVAWWMAVIARPGLPTLTATDYAAPLPESGFGVFTVYEVLKSLELSWSGNAISRDRPASIYRGDDGDVVQLGVELSWVTDGSPYHYDMTTRYEIPCDVSGIVTIAGVPITISGPGQRDHSWGVRDWWSFDWCWSAARLDDGTRIQATDLAIGDGIALGYVQRGEQVDPITALAVSAELDADRIPTRATMHVNGLTLEIVPLALGPLILTSDDGRVCLFPRMMASFTAADGRSGAGWIEWSQGQAAAQLG